MAWKSELSLLDKIIFQGLFELELMIFFRKARVLTNRFYLLSIYDRINISTLLLTIMPTISKQVGRIAGLTWPYRYLVQKH